MLKLEIKTQLSAPEATERIKDFLAGHGLEMQQQRQGCVTFEGGGGYVHADTWREEGRTFVDLETREWEHQVRELANKLTESHMMPVAR